MFTDGLKYEEPEKWDYCTYKDRRFYHEILHDIKNPEVDKYAEGKLYHKIPEGCYGNNN